MWPEIDQANGEKKRELKLSGAEISERIDSNGIDSELFNLDSLNLLNISDTTLQAIPSEISNLINLQTLLLYGNALQSIPDSIGKLDKLKVLDVSRNKLINIPDSIVNLQANLTMINLSSNQLTQFPALKKFAKLSVLNLSGNKLTLFPDIYSEDNVNLSEIILEDNLIDQIPHAIDQLTTLKHLSLAKNHIKTIPKSLANISKLKDLELIDNPVADKRLLKLIQQCRTKQVLDYVKQHGEDAPKSSDAANNQTSASKKSAKSKKSKKELESNLPQHKMIIKRYTDDSIKVIFDDALKDIRPFILCCITQVNLTDDKFRRFLQLQTKLHDTVCGRREKSTIATHDLKKLPVGNPFIAFTAKEPAKLRIHPLGKFRTCTAQKLYNELKAEAEALRKEKKRNVYSGIHKYLYLLENKTMFPCLQDSLGNVISLPPLTNADGTKISPETTSILIEVTSSTSMSDCRTTIDEFLKEILIGGFGATGDVTTEPNIRNTLFVQQIKVTDDTGNLRRVYPSKGDLEFEDEAAILVERE